MKSAPPLAATAREYLKAQARSADPRIAQLAVAALALQALLEADPLRPDRCSVAVRFVGVFDALLARDPRCRR
ncbi:MAG: hypothetical protein EOO73_05315 [Myxococcales bacterium]|nr:MAG: hypothetical protein EOO73_05315 [Myxococcales bacterium]